MERINSARMSARIYHSTRKLLRFYSCTSPSRVSTVRATTSSFRSSARSQSRSSYSSASRPYSRSSSGWSHSSSGFSPISTRPTILCWMSRTGKITKAHLGHGAGWPPARCRRKKMPVGASRAWNGIKREPPVDIRWRVAKSGGQRLSELGIGWTAAAFDASILGEPVTRWLGPWQTKVRGGEVAHVKGDAWVDLLLRHGADLSCLICRSAGQLRSTRLAKHL